MKSKLSIQLLLILLLFCLRAECQLQKADVKVSWGELAKAEFGSSVQDIFGYDKTGFYVLKNQRGWHAVSHVDYKMNQTAEGTINLKAGRRDGEFEFVDLLDNTVYVFYSENERKTKENVLYTETLDQTTLELKGDKKEVCRIPYVSKSNEGNFTHVFSRGKQSFLITCSLPYVKGSPERFNFLMYDNRFNLKWKKEIVLPVNDELFEMDRVKADDNGNAYISGRFFEGEKDRYKSKFAYKLYAYFNNGTEQKEFNLDLGDKRATDMQFAINDNGNITACGFYTDKEKGNYSIRGSFYALIDGTTRKVLSSSTKEFDIDFITQYMSEREEERTKKREENGKKQELMNYDIHEIVLRDDGGAILVAEQYYIRQVTTYSPGPNGGTYSTSTYYDYNDIIVVNITPDGKIEWTQKIHKLQESPLPASMTYTSYAIAVTGDAIRFIYNDYTENLLLGEKERYKTFRSVTKSTAVIMATIDRSGKLKREFLFDRNDSELNTKPVACEQTDANTFILFAQRKEKHQFAKIDFE
jgi:hypothetical protein